MNLKTFIEQKLQSLFKSIAIFFIWIDTKFLKPLYQRFADAHKINRLNRQLLREIKKAKKYNALTGEKQLVLFVDGQFACFSKSRLKVLVNRRYFIKGTTIQDLEKLAKYITT